MSMDRDSDIGWWLAVIVGVLLAIWTGALIFLIVMTLLVGWHRGYSRQAEEERSVERARRQPFIARFIKRA